MLAAACTDRTQLHDDRGHRLAQHLCPIQSTCDCGDELLIPSCEARVEHEYAASERTAVEAGLELDEACVEQALEDLDRLAACDRPSDTGTLCPLHRAGRGGRSARDLRLRALDDGVRAGLYCLQGTCRNLENPQLVYEGGVCSGDVVCAEGCRGLDLRRRRHAHLHSLALLAARPYRGKCTKPISCVDEIYCRP